MKRPSDKTFVKSASLIILPVILINAVLLLANSRPVFATTCSTGYYYAWMYDTDYPLSTYGVGTDSEPAGWTYNTADATGHQLFYADLNYAQGGVLTNNNWAQSGYGIGDLDGTSASSRVPYAEINVGGTVSHSAWTSYAIPNDDSGSMEAWTYQQNLQGDYIAHMTVYSPYWSTTFLTTGDVGPSNYMGRSLVAIETYYSGSYTCDLYSNYTFSWNAVFTLSEGTSDPLSVGSSWSSCSFPTPNSPYSLTSAGCSSIEEYYGG